MSEVVFFVGFVLLLSLMMGLLWIALRNRQRLRWIMMSMFFIFSCLGYWLWGSWPKWHHAEHVKRQQAQATAFLKKLPNTQSLIDKLVNHLQQKSNGQQTTRSLHELARGWYLLGRLYSGKGDWQAALRAFSKAHQLSPKDKKISINRVYAAWEINQRYLTPDLRQTLQNILQDDPNQPDALALLAMDAEQVDKPAEAIAYWQRLLDQLPPQSDDAREITQVLARLQRKV